MAVTELAARGASQSLFDYFTQFYEEVVKIKTAQDQGVLAGFLTVGDAPAPEHPLDFAARASARLALFLEQQARVQAQTGSVAEIEAGTQARYAMAALADEILILEFSWPGQKAWGGVLLEDRLFHSRVAGRRFYALTEKLLASHSRTVLDADLALVMLMALELGFKGMYRGHSELAALDSVKQKLYQFIRGRHQNPDRDYVFQQAYQNCRSGGLGQQGARLAPLAPWYNAALIAGVVYLLMSVAVWLFELHPFLSLFA